MSHEPDYPLCRAAGLRICKADGVMFIPAESIKVALGDEYGRFLEVFTNGRPCRSYEPHPFHVEQALRRLVEEWR